jgi:putative redox protein
MTENHKAQGQIQNINFQTRITAGQHHFIADEAKDVGGSDLGPNPGQLLSAALAACASITMRMYANRKGWPLEEAVVEVDFQRNIQDNTTMITKKITLIGALDQDQINRLHEIADKCPVHKVLTSNINIQSFLSE